MDKILNNWKKNFESVGIENDLKEEYLAYIKSLLDRGAPIIFDLQHLAKLLGRKPYFLADVINSNRNFYRVFLIPKRRGGKREISAPYPSLLECQEWIYINILKKYIYIQQLMLLQKKNPFYLMLEYI